MKKYEGEVIRITVETKSGKTVILTVVPDFDENQQQEEQAAIKIQDWFLNLRLKWLFARADSDDEQPSQNTDKDTHTH